VTFTRAGDNRGLGEEIMMNPDFSPRALPHQSFEDESPLSQAVRHWTLVREIEDLEEILTDNGDQAEHCDSVAAFLEEVRMALAARRSLLRAGNPAGASSDGAAMG